MKAVLFKSLNRFDAFLTRLNELKIETTVLDFSDPAWIDFDYATVDFVIYFSNFKYSSNHPLALYEVYDNLIHLSQHYPHLKMFPDPNIIRFYNDKYKQYLFLTKNGFPIPPTLPLYSEACVVMAEQRFGYPLILKNRYGAGGDYVLKIETPKQLRSYYNFSKLNLFNFAALKYFFKLFSNREFLYLWIKERNMKYPFFSAPLLAQKFIKIDCDLKIVVGDGEVVEGHWRRPADTNMWKMNIDGGGVGVWSYIPESILELSTNLASKLNTSWLNIDLFQSGDQFVISEFSPVWHHYRYKEKPSFIYAEDYNVKMPLEKSLKLEEIIIESLINRVKNK